jgi:hypothetical protein
MTPETRKLLSHEIKMLGLGYADTIHESYNHHCSCGEGEMGEMSCQHCNASMAATRQFEREIDDLLSDFPFSERAGA